ncbi:MAG: carboxypeptidase regulatory-like domain-containing protein [Anaerolineae bacterium]|nr:carboxypeptidase regulatory-like domain-containing protein [Anaerolineae bacterium]
MRRFPARLLMAVAGLLVLMLSLMAMVDVDVDAQTEHPLAPTIFALLTQMPPQAVATQLAGMGYPVPANVQATAVAMQQQGVPPDVIIRTLLAFYGVVLPPVQPTTVPVMPTSIPVQPTNIPVQPTTIPGQPTQIIVIPPVMPSIVPVQPTAVPVLPTFTPLPPTPVPVGSIAGSVKYAHLETATGILLTLTRPDGSTLELPVSADGQFMFSSMTPGAYTLVASAPRYLSARAEFSLEQGKAVQLPPAELFAGDTNEDSVIDLLDAALIAANFDGPATVVEADLNGDDWIDVRDLTIIGRQFGMAAPTSWQ